MFMEQRKHSFDVWQEPFVTLRLPKLFNLRTDPFERADHEGIGYATWRIDRAFLIGPAAGFVGQWLQSFREFPPRQKPGSFNLSHVMEKLSNPSGSRRGGPVRGQGRPPRTADQPSEACSGSGAAPEQVAEVVIDGVQVLRGAVHRAHLDHEHVADHAIAERPLRRVGAVPGEVRGIAVAGRDARTLGGGKRGRQVLDRVGLDQLPQQVALRRGSRRRRRRPSRRLHARARRRT